MGLFRQFEFFSHLGISVSKLLKLLWLSLELSIVFWERLDFKGKLIFSDSQLAHYCLQFLEFSLQKVFLVTLILDLMVEFFDCISAAKKKQVTLLSFCVAFWKFAAITKHSNSSWCEGGIRLVATSTELINCELLVLLWLIGCSHTPSESIFRLVNSLFKTAHPSVILTETSLVDIGTGLVKIGDAVTALSRHLVGSEGGCRLRKVRYACFMMHFSRMYVSFLPVSCKSMGKWRHLSHWDDWRLGQINLLV